MSLTCALKLSCILLVSELRRTSYVYFLFFREFSLDVSVEMPNKISELHCFTHSTKMKVIYSLINIIVSSACCDIFTDSLLVLDPRWLEII